MEDVEEEPPRRFTGPCGLENLCGTVNLGSQPLLRLVLQVPANERAAKRLDPAETLLNLLLHDLRGSLRLRIVQWERQAAESRPLPVPSDSGAAGGIEESASNVVPTSMPAGKVVRSMLDYVRDHYHQPMGLKDIAKDLGMNANYLSTLFHRATGITFHHYLDARRMSKAEELLRDPHVRIADVARAVGYPNANHFRKVFKAREKVSPTAWAARQP